MSACSLSSLGKMLADEEHLPVSRCSSFCCPAILQCRGESHIRVAKLSCFYFGCRWFCKFGQWEDSFCYNRAELTHSICLEEIWGSFWFFQPGIALLHILNTWNTLLFPFLSSFKGHMTIHLLFDLEPSQMEAQREISETTTLICTFTWRSIIRKELKMPWSAWKLGKLFSMDFKKHCRLCRNWEILICAYCDTEQTDVRHAV